METEAASLDGAEVAAEPFDEFEQLYRARWTGMVRLAYLLTGSEAVAEEVVQDAFLQLRDRWATVLNPGAYLRTSVVNRSRTAVRREVREASRRERPTVVLPPDVDELWAQVCRLPELQRSVVVLKFYEDLSEAEIAEVLGCRPGTVKSRLHRGLARLKGATR